jgi:hypothetical protein
VPREGRLIEVAKRFLNSHALHTQYAFLKQWADSPREIQFHLRPPRQVQALDRMIKDEQDGLIMMKIKYLNSTEGNRMTL